MENRYNKFKKTFNEDNTKEEHLIKKYFDEDVDKEYYLDKNLFPYNVEDRIAHYVLWINPKKDVEDEIIFKYLGYIFDDVEHIYFENNKNNRSIKIKHFQVFAKL